MPPIHRVNSPRLVAMLLCHALITISLFVALPLHGSQRGPKVIDFTQPAAQQSDLLSAPGFSSGAAAYSLPISVLIQSVERLDSAGNFKVELLLSNPGQSDFELPISRDSSQVLRAGNKERKTFLFKLSLVGTMPEQTVTQTVISTSGSNSIPDSQILLRPGESTVIVLKADVNFLKSHDKEAKLTAVCSEWTLDDARFYIKAASREVKSVNSVKLQP